MKLLLSVLFKMFQKLALEIFFFWEILIFGKLVIGKISFEKTDQEKVTLY